MKKIPEYPNKKQLNFFITRNVNENYAYQTNQLHRYLTRPSVFSPAFVKQNWKEWIERYQARQNTVPAGIDFYVHIPFCHSKCTYCINLSWPISNRFTVDLYIAYLIRNFSYYSDVFSKICFKNLYIGGGTPSLLNKTQIKQLFTELFKRFKFANYGQRTFECHPDGIRYDKLCILRKLGFNRISFGIQTTTKNVSLAHKRKYKSKQEINKILKLIKKAGFKYINADLILGLAGESLFDFQNSISEIASLKPYSITVYGLHPPNIDYCYRYFRMDKSTYFKTYLPKIAYLGTKIMENICNKAGYTSYSNPAKFSWNFRQNSIPPESNNLNPEFYKSEGIFGQGTFSKSYIPGRLDYMQSKEAHFFNPTAKIYSGWKLK